MNAPGNNGDENESHHCQDHESTVQKHPKVTKMKKKKKKTKPNGGETEKISKMVDESSIKKKSATAKCKQQGSERSTNLNMGLISSLTSPPGKCVSCSTIATYNMSAKKETAIYIAEKHLEDDQITPPALLSSDLAPLSSASVSVIASKKDKNKKKRRRKDVTAKGSKTLPTSAKEGNKIIHQPMKNNSRNEETFRARRATALNRSLSPVTHFEANGTSPGAIHIGYGPEEEDAEDRVTNTLVASSRRLFDDNESVELEPKASVVNDADLEAEYFGRILKNAAEAVEVVEVVEIEKGRSCCFKSTVAAVLLLAIIAIVVGILEGTPPALALTPTFAPSSSPSQMPSTLGYKCEILWNQRQRSIPDRQHNKASDFGLC
jgi:hypothetical protein